MPAKLERCVSHIKDKRGVNNAYAICNASMKKKMKKERSMQRRRK